MSTLQYLAALVLAANLLAQGTHPVTGRRFAPVMSAAGADWLDRSEREIEEEPEKALDALTLRPGMIIADVGAGSGYFTLRMARRVAPQGRVYATDIQPRMIELLQQNTQRAGIKNVEAVLSTESDARLPANSLDLILLVDVYHEFSQPEKMLAGLRQALKPEGRLVLLEYRKEDPNVPIRLEHKMTVAEVKAELESASFRMDRVIDSLPRQHILIFTRKPQ